MRPRTETVTPPQITVASVDNARIIKMNLLKEVEFIYGEDGWTANYEGQEFSVSRTPEGNWDMDTCHASITFLIKDREEAFRRAWETMKLIYSFNS